MSEWSELQAKWADLDADKSLFLSYNELDFILILQLVVKSLNKNKGFSFNLLIDEIEKYPEGYWKITLFDPKLKGLRWDIQNPLSHPSTYSVQHQPQAEFFEVIIPHWVVQENLPGGVDAHISSEAPLKAKIACRIAELIVDDYKEHTLALFNYLEPAGYDYKTWYNSL